MEQPDGLFDNPFRVLEEEVEFVPDSRHEQEEEEEGTGKGHDSGPTGAAEEQDSGPMNNQKQEQRNTSHSNQESS